jgi:hypothetical protein
MSKPFNQQVHDNLVYCGFTHTQYEESWRDEGNTESGPFITGGPAFDEYLRESDMSRVIVLEDGAVEYWGDAEQWDFDPVDAFGFPFEEQRAQPD